MIFFYQKIEFRVDKHINLRIMYAVDTLLNICKYLKVYDYTNLMISSKETYNILCKYIIFNHTTTSEGSIKLITHDIRIPILGKIYQRGMLHYMCGNIYNVNKIKLSKIRILNICYIHVKNLTFVLFIDANWHSRTVIEHRNQSPGPYMFSNDNSTNWSCSMFKQCIHIVYLLSVCMHNICGDINSIELPIEYQHIQRDGNFSPILFKFITESVKFYHSGKQFDIWILKTRNIVEIIEILDATCAGMNKKIQLW